jgi:hypothetical protein
VKAPSERTPLVIADQRDLAVVAAERCHAVVRTRRRPTVGHGVAGPAVGEVLESPRKHQQLKPGGVILHRTQRSVVRARRALGHRRGSDGAGAERLQRPQRDQGGGSHAAAEKLTAVGAAGRGVGVSVGHVVVHCVLVVRDRRGRR